MTRRSAFGRLAKDHDFPDSATMARLVLRRAQGMVFLAILTVALVATAFAHRMPSAQDAAVQDYVAAGGALADLCGNAEGKGDAAHRDCPACSIASNVLPVSGTPRVTDADLVFVASVVAPRESRALRHVPDPSRSSQSPPLA
jgi:hypothetical protein